MFQQAGDQNTKPDLDLIEPGGMFRGVDKMDPMCGIGEKRGPGGHGFEDTALAFDPQIITEATVLGEPLDQASIAD